jgi:hypothetical protein
MRWIWASRFVAQAHQRCAPRSSRRAIRSITFTPAASRHAFGGSAAIPLAKCTAATIKNEECNIKISFFIFHFSFFISLW